jgi:hypothetical protein
MKRPPASGPALPWLAATAGQAKIRPAANSPAATGQILRALKKPKPFTISNLIFS